jgi:enamine deaminase RidA (YjgF/YER057c/UK114 family)
MYRATWQFNQAVRIRGGDLLFVSGIVGLAPDGSIATDDIVEQSQVAFENLSMVLEEAGGSLADVIKVNVYEDRWGAWIAG